MAEWLNASYADALTFIDPATATETEVRDAFRGYKPHGQQDRMVTLFLGLFEAAGIAPERKKRSSPRPQNGASVRLIRRERSAASPSSAAPPPPTLTHTPHRREPHITGFPPALAGLLTSLPQPGETWTKGDRERFLRTFEAVLDFCYPVTTAAKQNVVTQEEDDRDDK
jgi:hypothetical protein